MPILFGVRVRLTDAEWALAKQVCTEKQLAALELWRLGAGARRMATLLGVDPSTARARVRAGLRRITDAVGSAE